MAKYAFLSDDWIAEARRVYAEAEGGGSVPSGTALGAVRLNLVVTQVPFTERDLDAHVDTSAGGLAIDKGHLDAPDVTVALDYATAKSLFVAGDVQAVMQAFLSGRIRIDGDLTKLLDPRSGIWPATGAIAARPGGPGHEDNPGTEQGSGAPKTAALGLGAEDALDLASRLQQITE
jgi:hypothetical protein